MSDWFTLLPAVVAIVVILWRKEVILALLLSICTAEILLLLNSGSAVASAFFLNGPLQTVERMIAVVANADNARILLFSLMVGGLLVYMRDSGGISAMVNMVIRRGIAKTPRQAGLLALFISTITFIESILSALATGISSRGLFDKFKMSRARLAYIIDSTCSPISILILLNGWGAYILGLLGGYDLLGSNAVAVLIGTIPLNFYALFTIAVVVYTIITGKVYGPLRRSEEKLRSISTHTEIEVEPSHPAFMFVPLVTLVFSMLGFMMLTGDGNIIDGSGSKSVLYATILACLVVYSMMLLSKRFNHQQLVNMGFKGMAELLPLVTIVLLSLALSMALKQLGTGPFIASIVNDHVAFELIPMLLFLAGACISVTTGTSWGTFAILIPIGMPMVGLLELPPALILAAILSGGLFGDHCSPISDSTAVSAVASGCDLLEHVKTQLPYALFCALLSIIAFLIAGVLMI